MEPFRWAYIGSGSIARKTAKDILRGNHEITAVYSRNREKAGKFAEEVHAKAYPSFEELLEDACFDGVYIATPHTSHVPYSIQAMEAGKPVLCEKPVGICLSDVDALVNASRDSHVYFCEAMWTWFSDIALTVRQWIDEKRIGRIQRVHFDYAFFGLGRGRGHRLLMPETAGGSLLDIGIYPITYCYNLFGYPERIQCSGTIQDGIDLSEIVTLGYEGFDCTLDISITEEREECSIFGTEGEIHIPSFHMADSAFLKTGTREEAVSGCTDYLTEFSRAAEEIRSSRMESAYVPHRATRDCMRIMDECRRQMGLVYPFEK